MTSSSSPSQCNAVIEHVENTYKTGPYFHGARLAKDDGGLYAELRCARSKLPSGGAPLVGAVQGARVCTVVVG